MTERVDLIDVAATLTIASALRRHITTAKYAKKHNKGIRVGFVKPSDTRMMGDWPTRRCYI